MNFCTNCGNPLTATNTSSSSNKRKPFSIGKLIKRILIYLAIAAAGIGIWINHELNSTSYLTLSSEGTIFPKCGGEEEIGIDFDGTVWELTYKPSWVTIREYSNRIKITCKPNTSGRDRQDHITVKSGKIVQTLQIGQYGHAQYLEVTPEVLNCSKYDKCYKIKMKSDGIKPSFSCSSFLSISSLTKDGFTITVYPNYNKDSRTGIVIVEEDDVQAVINIYQEGWE